MTDDHRKKLDAAYVKLDKNEPLPPEESKMIDEDSKKIRRETIEFCKILQQEAEEQRERLWYSVVPDFVKSSIESKDKLVHCIKTPTGSGKTFSIKREVCEREDQAFTIFVRSHEQMDEYERDIRDIKDFGEEAYHHRGLGARKQCPEKLAKEFKQLFARGFKHVKHICEICEKKHKCDAYRQKPWERFEPFATERIVLAPHVLFPLVSGSKKFRKWQSKNGEIDRIFVVDENYFDTLRLPRTYSDGQIRQFRREFQNFYNEEGPKFPEIEELISRISAIEVKPRKFEIIPPVKEDFKISKRVWERAFNLFEKRNKMGTVCNLLAEFEGGVRNGVVVANPHGATPGKNRDYQFTFKVDNLRLPPLKNKLIITDATFKDGSEAWLSKILQIPQNQIEVHSIDEKAKLLSVWHYPFCHAPKKRTRQYLPRVKTWIDDVIEWEKNVAESSEKLRRVTRGTSPDTESINVSENQEPPSQIWTEENRAHVCIVSYQSYQDGGEQDAKHHKSFKGNIKEHFTHKHPYVKPIFFYYGNESGFDREGAKDSYIVLVIGKFQMPSNVIQALFLNSGLDLGYTVDTNGNVKFTNEELRKESDYYTFRASYQGASRARFFKSTDVRVHILSTEEIPDTWKEVLDLRLNYIRRELQDCPGLKSEFSRSKLLGPMIKVAEKTLLSEGSCCTKDIYYGRKNTRGELLYGKAGSPKTVYRWWEDIKLYFSGIAYSEKKKTGRNWTEYLRLLKDYKE